MRLKHRESPHEIIPQLDGQVSVILSEGFCVASTQNEFESFLYQKTMWRKISVSFMYVDEFENMSDSESATLDLKTRPEVYSCAWFSTLSLSDSVILDVAKI